MIRRSWNYGGPLGGLMRLSGETVLIFLVIQLRLEKPINNRWIEVYVNFACISGYMHQVKSEQNLKVNELGQ